MKTWKHFRRPTYLKNETKAMQSFLDSIAKLINELHPKTNQFTSTLDYLSVENLKSFCPEFPNGWKCHTIYARLFPIKVMYNIGSHRKTRVRDFINEKKYTIS